MVIRETRRKGWMKQGTRGRIRISGIRKRSMTQEAHTHTDADTHTHTSTGTELNDLGYHVQEIYVQIWDESGVEKGS
jgi:hypothetical protein